MEITKEEAFEFVQSLPPFANVPKDQLQWLVDRSEIVGYEKGVRVFEPDQAADHLRIIICGKVDVYVIQNGDYRQVTTIEKGNITGVLPFSRLQTTSAFGEAKEFTAELRFHRDGFREMCKDKYELTEAFVHHMTTRVREFTKIQQQSEKLMSLGKLSAGLAHELNNPAAAVVRSAESLTKHLKSQPEKFKKVMEMENV